MHYLVFYTSKGSVSNKALLPWERNWILYTRAPSWPTAAKEKEFLEEHGSVGQVMVIPALEGAVFDIQIYLARRALVEAVRKHIVPVDSELAGRIIYDLNNDYVSYSIDEPGKISYARQADDMFVGRRRVKTALGRYVSRRLGGNMTRALELAIHEVASITSYRPGDFEIREDVIAVYQDEVGSGSCMTDNPNNCLDFFEANGVRVLVYRGDRARALLWTLDDGTLFVDRIYPNDGPHIALYREWAKKNKAKIRKHHYCPDDNFVDEFLRVKVDVRNRNIPYMDTFLFGDNKFDALWARPYDHENDDNNSWHRGEAKDWVIYHSTEGENSSKYFEKCESCKQFKPARGLRGAYLNSQDRKIRSVCADCFEKATLCSHCQERYIEPLENTINGTRACRSCFSDYMSRLQARHRSQQLMREGRKANPYRVLHCPSCQTKRGRQAHPGRWWLQSFRRTNGNFGYVCGNCGHVIPGVSIVFALDSYEFLERFKASLDPTSPSFVREEEEVIEDASGAIEDPNVHAEVWDWHASLNDWLNMNMLHRQTLSDAIFRPEAGD